MAAVRPHAGRNYASRGARCITLSNRDITVRNTPAGPCARVCAFVTSDGIGTDGCGAAEPLCVTSDGCGAAEPLCVTSDGCGAAEPLCVTSDGIGTDGCGGTQPLCVTSDGIGGDDGFGGAEPLGDGG